MANEYELSIHDYLSIVRRRAPYMIGIFSAIMVIAIIISLAIPPTYRATGTIIVESQQISDNIIPSTIRRQLDEQINIIKQRLLTRENLIQLAEKFHLSSNIPVPTPDQLNKLRERIAIESDSAGNSIRTNQQGNQAIAFTISFEDRQPNVAFEVSRELINLFMELNVRIRTEGAIETTEFLTKESDKLKAELDRQENLISEYKQQHKNALPEQLTLRMTMLSRAENDMREVERDIRSAKEEIRTLEIELDAAKHGVGTDDHSNQSLPALKAELARLSGIYKESHPDIRRLKSKIEAAENAAVNSSPDSVSSSNLTVYRIQARIDSDKARLASLTHQRESLQSKIAENENAMIQTPKVGQGLDVLLRDRDIAQKKFEEFRSKRMNAKIAENLESENRTGRFSVLEPPLIPEKPFKPNRMKIILIGFIVAVASSIGIMMLLESFDKRIRGIQAITHLLGHPPLAVIPYLQAQDDVAKRKKIYKYSLIAAMATILVLIIALSLFYSPFNTMLINMLARL